ncbi:MAG: ATPase [Ruminococcaceae bacterium]|nr:ATPase [Oscillospiraceae bacterium]
MAVTSMRLVNVTGHLSKLDAVLDVCVEKGNFQFEQAMSFFGGNSDFAPINDENPYSRPFAALSAALSDAGLTPLEHGQLDKADVQLPESWEQLEEYITNFSQLLRQSAGRRLEAEKDIARMESELEQLHHFDGLDIQLQEIFECEFIKVRFGRLPRASYERLKYYSDNPYIMLQPCQSDDHYVWGAYFAPLENVAEVDRIFQSLMWERLHLPDAVGTPSEECAAMEQRIADLREEAAQADSEASAVWEEHKYECSLLYRMLERRSESFELRRNVAKYKHGDQFFLAGWIIAADEADMRQRMSAVEGIECEIEKPDAAEGHSPPVRLRNRAFARPFEFYVSMYGLPEYGETDPTPFVAITYFLLFGMMFADVGQGLVLSLVGWLFMWKLKGMALGRIIAWCGLSSAFFGVLLGSVFGFENWLDDFWVWVQSKTGIPLNHNKPINVEDPSVINMLIYATIGIGAVLVVCAMITNIYARLKQKQWGAALLSQNGLAGLVFYCSLIFIVLNMLIIGGPYPGAWFTILCIVLPLILIYLQEPLSELLAGEEHWMPESIGDFLMQSFFELFEVLLSYLSNTLSFVRVGAFILVHYGMMTVVFTIANFSPEGSFGYIAVVVIGNIIIMALEGLLVGIQALRLEFYEMFSRFYSGSGRPFVPVGTEIDG